MQLPEVFVVYSFFVFWHPGVLFESDYGARGLSSMVVFEPPGVLFESDYGARGLSAMALWRCVGRVLTKSVLWQQSEGKKDSIWGVSLIQIRLKSPES